MNKEPTETISSEEINKCISILEQLVANTDEIFDIPKIKRTASIKASEMLSRPSREEFSRRKKMQKKQPNVKKRLKIDLLAKKPGLEVHDFQPLLDIVDGAARVMDPLFDGINTGKHWCGQFLKDYKPIDW